MEYVHWKACFAGGSSCNLNTEGTDFTSNTPQHDPDWWDYVIRDFGTHVGHTARHMGMMGDITCGNQWMGTSNPGDSRFQNDDDRHSIIYLK